MGAGPVVEVEVVTGFGVEIGIGGQLGRRAKGCGGRTHYYGRPLRLRVGEPEASRCHRRAVPCRVFRGVVGCLWPARLHRTRHEAGGLGLTAVPWDR